MTGHVNDYNRIADRYGFIVPEQYRLARAKGLFDHGGSNELILTDLHWLTIDSIVDWKPLDFQIKGLVPFAWTAGRDLFCWYPAWAAETDVSVTFCPRDDENAHCYASNFFCFLYRILLEEFTHSWLVRDFGMDGTAERFRKYATNVGELLPLDWANTLREISYQPLIEREGGVHGLVDQEECDELIERDLSFPRLNEQFKHYV